MRIDKERSRKLENSVMIEREKGDIYYNFDFSLHSH